MAERPYVPFASTDPMRKRLRELADPDLDDFDRAVVIVLDDFERLLAWYEAARMDSNEELVAVRGLVEQQANDEGLWFVAHTAPEAYLQQELRKLHALCEALARLGRSR